MKPFSQILVTTTFFFAVLSGFLPVQQGLPVDFMPLDLRSGSAPLALRKAYQKGLVYTQTSQQKVFVQWMAGATINQPEYKNYFGSLDPSEPMPVTQGHKEYGTRMYPNAACRLGNDRVLVAGVFENGDATIERWDFTYPTPFPAPVTDSATGITSVQIGFPTRKVHSLYRQPSTSTGCVRALSELKIAGAPATHALVLWDETGEISTVDLATGTVTLLAGANGGSYGAIPELGSVRFISVQMAEHASLGYIYRIHRATSGLGEPQWPALVLVDLDRDGVIDSHQLHTAQSWAIAGLSDESTYINPWYF